MVRCFPLLVQSARFGLLATAFAAAGGQLATALPYRFRIIAEPGDVIERRTIRQILSKRHLAEKAHRPKKGGNRVSIPLAAVLDPRFITSLVSFVLMCASSASGAVINSNTTIDAGNSFPGESVEVVAGVEPPTTVVIQAGGEVGANLILRDSSVITMVGGTVGENVFLYDNSRFSMSGGLLKDDLISRDDSIVRVFGGVILESIVGAGRSSLSIFGSVRGDDLSSFDLASIQLRGGEFLDDDGLRAYGMSTVNIYGGMIRAREGETDILATESSTINVFGVDLALSGELLTGTLADGTPLNLRVRTVDQGQIILHTIPEPQSLMIQSIALVSILARYGIASMMSRRGRNREVARAPG